MRSAKETRLHEIPLRLRSCTFDVIYRASERHRGQRSIGFQFDEWSLLLHYAELVEQQRMRRKVGGTQGPTAPDDCALMHDGALLFAGRETRIILRICSSEALFDSQRILRDVL